MTTHSREKPLPKRIAVITSSGGSEQAVSLRSADNVATALRENFDSVGIFPFDADLENGLQAWKPDVVFPVAHGKGGESGELQALLDSMQLFYVGSGSASSALCWDKAAANASVSKLLAVTPALASDFSRCAVPPFVTLQRGDDIPNAILDFCNHLPSKDSVIVVKPAGEGSSCGISFFTSPHCPLATREEVIGSINGPILKARLEHIASCVERTFAFGNAVIVQEAVHGTEITVAVLEDPDARALPVIEIVTPRGAWYDYEYSVGGSKHIIPARLPDWVVNLAQQVAVAVHRHLACRDLSRVDFIVTQPETLLNKHRLLFLETNTLPGMTETSLFPDMARADGMSIPELVRKLVLMAWQRRDAATRVEPSSNLLSVR